MKGMMIGLLAAYVLGAVLFGGAYTFGLLTVGLLAVLAAQGEVLVKTMREVRDELRRHSNATVECPKCKGRIPHPCAKTGKWTPTVHQTNTPASPVKPV
jgi:hypothetical protein